MTKTMQTKVGGGILLTMFIIFWTVLTTIGDVEPFLIFKEPDLISQFAPFNWFVILVVTGLNILWLWASFRMLSGKNGLPWKN